MSKLKEEISDVKEEAERSVKTWLNNNRAGAITCLVIGLLAGGGIGYLFGRIACSLAGIPEG